MRTYNSENGLKVYNYKAGGIRISYEPGTSVGHAASVVGYDANGVIMSSYGDFFYVTWEDVASDTISFDITGLSLEDGNLEE